jgi:type IV secretion system protein VirB8
MNPMSREELGDYYAAAESWSDDRARAEARSRRVAWIVAGIAAVIALLEAIALVALIPLKREVPYTLMVDRQTGYVQALQPLESERLTADAALTRSFLVQYVIARESFDADTLQSNYQKVGLFSAGEARERYLAQMRSSNPASPLVGLPRNAAIDVEVRSVSSIAADTAMVRFTTIRTDPGGRSREAQNHVATIRYRYTDAEMSAADRLINPLGFQVVRYRKDAETLPELIDDPAAPATAAPAAVPVGEAAR